ncbi:hypothetical protein ACWGJ0_03630 [Streptomyces massasporeus]
MESSNQSSLITDEHRQRLATILPNSDIDATLEKIAQAGAAELLDYCTGRIVPTTISELRANRLNYLLKSNMKLTELEGLVAGLFQIPGSTAARLVKTASSRFAYEWNSDFKELLRESLENQVEWIDDEVQRFQLTLTSALARGWMQDQVKSANVSDIEDTKKGGVIRLQEDTYDYLCTLAGATRVEKQDKRGKKSAKRR